MALAIAAGILLLPGKRDRGGNTSWWGRSGRSKEVGNFLAYCPRNTFLCFAEDRFKGNGTVIVCFFHGRGTSTSSLSCEALQVPEQSAHFDRASFSIVERSLCFQMYKYQKIGIAIMFPGRIEALQKNYFPEHTVRHSFKSVYLFRPCR